MMMMMSNYGFPIKTEYMINETAELIIPDNRHNTSVDNSNIEYLSSVIVKTEPLDPIIVKTETIDPIDFLCGEENSRDSVESQVKYKHKHLTNATDVFNEDSSSEELPVLFQDAGKDLTNFSEVFKPHIKYNKDQIEKSLSTSHKCEYCEYVTASRLCLRQHEKNGCHPRFKCSYCDYSVHGRRTMFRHIELHSSEMAITCDYCNFLALTQFAMSLHCKKVHQNQLKPPSMLHNHLETPSKLQNQLEPPSVIQNRLESPTMLENSSMSLNRLKNSSVHLNKLESYSNSVLNKLESPTKHQNQLELHSWLVNQLESPSTGLNQTESPSTGLNQTESPSTGLNQTESPSTGLNQTESPSTGLNQTESPTTGLNQTESPTTGLNQTESPTTGLNQTESPSTGLNQTESPSTGLNQTESPSTGLNQTESPSTGLNQTESPSTGLNQTESPTTGLNQTESPTTGLNQTESPTTGLNQTESPLMGLNQWHSPSTGLNQLEPPSMGLNQLELNSMGLNHLEPSSTGLNHLEPSSTGLNQSQATISLTQLEPLSTPLNWFVPPSTSRVNKLGRPSKLQNQLEFNSWHLQQSEPPSLGLNQLESQAAIDRNNPQLFLTDLNGFEPPSSVLSHLEPPSMDSDFHSPYTNQRPSTGSNKTRRPPDVEVLPLSNEITSLTLSYKCHLCPFITSSIRLLMRHSRQRHKKRNYRKLKHTSKFKCNLCNYQSFQKKDFRIHSRTCPNMKARYSWKSKICDYSILYRGGMCKMPLRIFKCEHCDYICERKGLLKYHLTSKHNLKGQFVKGFKCFRCNERFKNKVRVKVHCRKALVLNETQPSRPRKNYRCLFCVFHTNSKNFFDSHFRSKHRKNGLKCLHCKNTFKYLNILNQHLSKYHNFCKLCNVGFPNKRTFINHEPIHYRKCYVTMKKLLPRFSVPSVILCFKKITPKTSKVLKKSMPYGKNRFNSKESQKSKLKTPLVDLL